MRPAEIAISGSLRDEAPVAKRAAMRIRVDGIVQGVGFRPFVFGLAQRLGLAGSIANDLQGVAIEVEGSVSHIAEFRARLVSDAPPLAFIQNVTSEPISIANRSEFEILASHAEGERDVLISPDIATCDDCIREIFDPLDRRYRYPFTNCTNCGPRFTVVRNVPYDRSRTTMAEFPMCADCAREYHDPSDRRFHAEPVCCPACGPSVRLIDRNGIAQADDPIRKAAELLKSGKVVAVKGLGGYHCAALASDENAVKQLRSRKHREDKPFAVMAPNLESAHALAIIDDLERRALINPRRPVVLLNRRTDAALAHSVAPSNRYIGVMLPYTPLHHLLCESVKAPIVFTSGNVSDEPIAYTDDNASKRLSAIADYFLIHNRQIHIRTDDSVVRISRGREVPQRRSRGYAPQPIELPFEARRPILACGAELKNTFCVAKRRHAFVSHHIGDLENFETLHSFREGIDHFRRLFDIVPAVVAYDLHPEYLSTKYALDLKGVEFVGVQHHHAHIAACLADNGEQGPAIGVAFDGLGFGLDGTIWGGEFLIADLAKFERVGHLEAVPMPGGTAAIKQPWRMAASYLGKAYGESVPEHLDVAERNANQWRQITALIKSRVNSPLTSSAGRLFDAVAAILSVRDAINYEGQAAIELEQLASVGEDDAYELSVSAAIPFEIHGAALVRSVVDDLRAGTSVEIVAARFHNSVALMIVKACAAIRTIRGLTLVALSGGAFQNQLLLRRTVRLLEEAGFRVLTHRQVPTNDAGISFGQVAVAAARDRAAAAGED
jgi:hydrogenase maturation protein HypF